MTTLFKKWMGKMAQPPGTLIHVGEQKTETMSVCELSYNPETVTECDIPDINEYSIRPDFKGVTWLDINGIHDTSVIERVGGIFNIHGLVLEDILNTFQRPKIQDFDEHLFLVLKMLSYDTEKNELRSEQVSFLVGADWIISFQERPGDVFEPVRERIRKDKGRIRKMKADYLLYALVDAIVDNYFVLMEAVGTDIEEAEASIVESPSPEILHLVQKLRKELIFLRKGVWPLREILNTLLRGETKLVEKTTLIYIRDIYDHTIQVIETTETYRDMVSGLQDLYLSSISNRMNEVMKVLTIIATLFIPLTFIAGVYGMNFEFMPELKWKLGYFLVLGVMLLLGLGMFLFFRRKKWL